MISEMPKFGVFADDPEERKRFIAAQAKRKEKSLVTEATKGRESVLDGDIIGQEQIVRSVTNKNLEQAEEMLAGSPSIEKIKGMIALMDEHIEHIQEYPTDKGKDKMDIGNMEKSLKLLKIAEKILSEGGSFEIAKILMSPGAKEYLRGLSLKLNDVARMTIESGRLEEVQKVKNEMVMAISVWDNINAVDEEAVKDSKLVIEMLKKDIEQA